MEEVAGLTRAVIRRYAEHDLLTFAGALAYKVLFAIIPLVLFGLGLAGGLGFDERWSSDWAPTVKNAVSPPVFQVIDDAARRALSGEQTFWITAGTALSVGAWLVTSLALGWYATSVADYGNVYGALATFVILLTYLYLAAAAFLTGVELDDLLRDARAPSARPAA
jgi:uncharacterized BrkB/YihY/UPF0761 family membrane protein